MKLTRKQLMEALRMNTGTTFYANADGESPGLQFKSPDIIEYIEALESRLITLATHVADGTTVAVSRKNNVP